MDEDRTEEETHEDEGPEEEGEPEGTEGGPAEEKGAKRKRLVVAGLAAAAVAALAIGGLALSQGGNQPAPEEPPAQGETAEEDQDLDADGILALARGLAFAGADVSAPEGAECSVDGGSVTLAQASAGDLATEVPALARRAAALAHALDGRTAGGEAVLDVTCVLADSEGSPIAAVTATPDSASAQASAGEEDLPLAELLSGCTGWSLSDEAWDAVGGEASGAAQSGGVAPTGPDGAELVALPAEEPAEEEGDGDPEADEGEEEPKDTTDGDAQAPQGHPQATSSAGSGSDAGPTSGQPSQTQPSTPSQPSGGQASQAPAETKPAEQAKPTHTHDYSTPVYGEKKWVVDVPARDEPVYGTKTVCICSICGTAFDSPEAWAIHDIESHDDGSSYSVVQQKVQTGTKHVDEQGHWETPTIGWRCSCGATKGN